MEVDEIQPPLGLGYLATAIRDKHSVRILDCVKEKMEMGQFRKELAKEKYDAIGIQCYTFSAIAVKEMISIIKGICPDAITIIGGPGPSVEPNIVHEFINANFGFKGEAEIGFPMLIESIGVKNADLGSIPGLIWKNGKEIMINQQGFIDNLDELKQPSWDLLMPESYPLAPHGAFFKKMPTAPIFATRGCPYCCTFCAGFAVSGRKIRHRSIKSIVDEIEMLHKDHGINEIHIEDDNFTLKRQFVVDFCNELARRKLDIAWACPNGVRLDTLDAELLAMMKKSGLYVVSVGIESGSNRILKDMRKSLTKEKIREKVNLIHAAGLDIVGFFILGYPGETTKDINATIDFACELPLKRASFMLFKPFPGTEATERIKHELCITEKDRANFSLHKVAYSPKGMTFSELKKLRRKALLRFYMRPKIIFSLYSNIKSFQHLKYVLLREIRWLT